VDSLSAAIRIARAPWTLIKSNPDQAALVVRFAVNLIGICARAAWPIIPVAAERALGAIGDLQEVPPFPSTDDLNRISARSPIVHPGPLFAKVGADWAETQRLRFARQDSPPVEQGRVLSSC
jgi:methionyl-tRNA synthetase